MRRTGPLAHTVPILFVIMTVLSCRHAWAQEVPFEPSPPPSSPSPWPPIVALPPPEDRGALVARDGYPLAGRAGEHFYLRDAKDDFRIYFDGRAHFDAYVPFGAGVSSSAPGSGLQPTFFLRRARPELSGEFLERWQWMISGEWGRTTVDNGNGQTATSSCAANPTTGALSCTTRSSPVEAPSYQAQPTDVSVNYRAAPELNFQGGQLRIPFTLENRTSENVTPFLETSLPVRTIGAPTIRDIGVMAWGELRHGILNYALGIFDGDGPNRLNQDSNFDYIGRVFFHPFLNTRSVWKTFQVGASGHYGVRDSRTVGYDYTTFTTQEGYAFWRPTYTDSNGNLIHILPSARQVTAAAELYWPVSIVDLTAELVYADHDTREARDGYQLQYPFTERYGKMNGYSYYAQVSVWAVGDRQYVRRPGYFDPPHVDFNNPLPPTNQSLEFLAKVEQLRMTYSSASRGGTADSKSPDGVIAVDAVSVGVNYWATRRVRLSVDYDIYFFPGSEPVTPSQPGGPSQSASQRAVAPAQGLAKGVDDAARESSHTFNELSARLAVGF